MVDRIHFSDTISTMKKYKIKSPIMLSFQLGNNQSDCMFHPEDADYTITCDGHTIWITNGVQSQESITMANAIDIWVKQGKLVEFIEKY